jgi:diketogulonate reductase-like aldo/keto reductase
MNNRWDYKNKYYYDAISHLMHLKETEKIKNIGLTNFDTVHLADLIGEGAPIVSNQVPVMNALKCLPSLSTLPFRLYVTGR